MITVRFNPRNDFIEFEVELDQICIKDFKPKDVTVNWHFYDDFDSKGEFYTDSNGLSMVKRNIKEITTKVEGLSEKQPNMLTISGNYFPVTQAISMKDNEKNV
jgi:hypothetical protein